ncbi:hypothetical protein D3C73_1055230 [compost metagenome]
MEVLVHEICHQWWGINTLIVQDGQSAWGPEGITNYSTYLFFKNKYGEEYGKRMIEDWQEGYDSMQNSFYMKNPEYLNRLSEEDISTNLSPQTGITMYNMMPLQLLKAEELVGGEEAFR